MHNEANANPCGHVDCENNPRRFTSDQLKDHMRSVHDPKTIKCDLPGCETSEAQYNKTLLYAHINRHHVELCCFFSDCGAPLRSWETQHAHIFICHDKQWTLEDVRAAASTSANVKSRDDSNTPSLDHRGNEPKGLGQVEAADEYHLSHEEEEDVHDLEEWVITTNECEEDLGDNLSIDDSDDDYLSGKDSDDDIIGEEDEGAGGSEAEIVILAHEIRTILNCAIDSEISADVRSYIKERNLRRINRWGLTNQSSTSLLFSSGQAPKICCGSGPLRYCHFKCFSGESLSLETARVLKKAKVQDDGCYHWQLSPDTRCWRCRAFVRQLFELKPKGILLENGPQVFECAQDGCSQAPWVGTKYCHDDLTSALKASRKTPELFVKRLRCVRDLRKARDMKRDPNSYLQIGYDIEEPADMLEFFKSYELDKMNSNMKTLLRSIVDGNDSILLVDTEFAGPFLIQLSIRNARGELLFSATVDYEMSVKELYEKVVARTGPFQISVGVLDRFYGPPSSTLTKDCPNTRTLVNIFEAIEQDKIIQSQHKIIEWSTCRCDYRYIYAAAEKANYTYLMPSLEGSVPCILPLRKAMPGLFSFSLPYLFYLLDPKSGLSFNAHVAEVDTFMFCTSMIIFALKASGRKDEFLPYWEKYQDHSEDWTKFFMKEWMKQPVQAQSHGLFLDFPAVPSRKRSLKSAGKSKAFKKARTGASGNKLSKASKPPTKARTKPLAVPKKQGSTGVQRSSADQEEANPPETRQSSRIKDLTPMKYGGASDADDSDDFMDPGVEADDESE